MKRFSKIFTSGTTMGPNARDRLNNFLKVNPDVEIIGFDFKVLDNGSQYLFVLFERKTDDSDEIKFSCYDALKELGRERSKTL